MTSAWLMLHVTELRRVVAMIEILLSIHIWSLKWSDQWRISSLITSSSLKYPLIWNCRQSNSVSRSISLNFCLHGAPRRNTELDNFLKQVIENLHVANFQRLTNQILCNWSYWFRIPSDTAQVLIFRIQRKACYKQKISNVIIKHLAWCILSLNSQVVIASVQIYFCLAWKL